MIGVGICFVLCGVIIIGYMVDAFAHDDPMDLLDACAGAVGIVAIVMGALILL
jgi:F0F1-type ATP synthase assembly protein I